MFGVALESVTLNFENKKALLTISNYQRNLAQVRRCKTEQNKNEKQRLAVGSTLSIS